MKSIDKKGNIVYRNSNGSLHRENGPAVEHIDGYKAWYLNGINYTEQGYKYEMRSRKLKQLL